MDEPRTALLDNPSHPGAHQRLNLLRARWLHHDSTALQYYIALHWYRSGTRQETEMDDSKSKWLHSDHKRRASFIEWMTEQSIQAFVSAGDMALDIGANYGAHTITMLKQVGPAGRVFAFEANPKISKHLAKWSEKNPLTVIDGAVTDYNGTASFYVGQDPGFSSLDPESLVKHHQNVSEEIVCQTFTLDTALQAYSLHSLRFVKIDVEGAELSVLRGGQGTLLTHRPMIVVECRLGAIAVSQEKNYEEFQEVFIKAGYQIISLFGNIVTESIPIDEYQFVLMPLPNDFGIDRVVSFLKTASSRFFADEKLVGWTPYKKFEGA